MLKQYFCALNKAPCFLLNKFLHTNISFQVINADYLAKLTQRVTSFLPLLKKPLAIVFSRQNKPNNNFSLIIRLSLVVLPLIVYLFLTPNTVVQANWAEKVIPAPTSLVSTLSYELIAEKNPTFFAPVHGYISTYFSSFHPGIDIPNLIGSPAAAAEKGTVVFAGWTNSGHGNLVVIRHNSGFETLYAHLSGIDVKVGQVVSQGEIIGQVGSTGFSTGPHLHFEIHLNGVPQNPLKYFIP